MNKKIFIAGSIIFVAILAVAGYFYFSKTAVPPVDITSSAPVQVNTAMQLKPSASPLAGVSMASSTNVANVESLKAGDKIGAFIVTAVTSGLDGNGLGFFDVTFNGQMQLSGKYYRHSDGFSGYDYIGFKPDNPHLLPILKFQGEEISMNNFFLSNFFDTTISASEKILPTNKLDEDYIATIVIKDPEISLSHKSSLGPNAEFVKVVSLGQ